MPISDMWHETDLHNDVKNVKHSLQPLLISDSVSEEYELYIDYACRPWCVCNLYIVTIAIPILLVDSEHKDTILAGADIFLTLSVLHKVKTFMPPHQP